MLNYGFNNYKTIAPFKTMNTVLKDDTYGFLKTGNELSTYKIPLKHLNDVTVMLEKNQSASKLTYKCKDNKYIILGNPATVLINWKIALICELFNLSMSSITTINLWF